MRLITDAFLINLSFLLAYYLRFKLLVSIGPERAGSPDQYIGVMVFVTILWLAVFNLAGFYRETKIRNLIDELAKVFVGITFASLLLFGLLFLYRGFWFSRLLILNAWWISFLLISAARMALYFFRVFLYRRGIGVKRVLILGGEEIAKALRASLGYQPVGFVGADPMVIKQAIALNKADELIISSSALSEQKILDIITECEVTGIEFKIIPGMLDLIVSRVNIDEVGGIPLITISEIGLSGIKAVIKRTFDILISSILLLFLLPLFLVVALLIKLDSSGAVFFTQKRVGKDGKIFNCLKFRSMVENAAEQLKDLQSRSEVEGHIFKIKSDPRVTRVGTWIRKFSIDELPQLINVFIGEMSLVGPRPPLPNEVEKYSTWHKKRLRITPGITGLWQVSGRSLLPFEDMVRLDIYYIENWSLWMDIKILFRTIPAVLFTTGAY